MIRSILLILMSVGFFFGLTGFNLTNTIVPKEDILSGGPPKDGIPAILAPDFIPVDAVDYLSADDQVISVTIDGRARAYPIKILNWHEAVNDAINGHSFVVTF